jgi:DNA-binding MarR family transcriptional regulator
MNKSELSSLLRESVSGLHKRLRKQSPAVKSYSMTETETIGHLFRNAGLLPTELAALTRVKTQSMSQVLKKLEEENIIKRTPSKADKRKVYISLTAHGKKIVEKTRYERDEWLKNAIEETLSDREKELLIKALPILNKLIQA